MRVRVWVVGGRGPGGEAAHAALRVCERVWMGMGEEGGGGERVCVRVAERRGEECCCRGGQSGLCPGAVLGKLGEEGREEWVRVRVPAGGAGGRANAKGEYEDSSVNRETPLRLRVLSFDF